MSSFFGNSNAQPAKPPNLANLTANLVATNQQGVVIRYFSGRQRMALTWLGPGYNQKTKEVQSGGGSKFSSGASSGHDYYADCAGLACLGPVDSIQEIWMNNYKVWSGNVTRSGDSADITIPNKGTTTIYWGTETQTAPSVLAAHGHPPYRGQCYLWFPQLYFGRDTTTAPNIEVVISRQPTGLGLATEADWDSDTNPAHCMVELITNPRYGLGWNGANTLDLTAWDAAAAQLRTEQIGISPLIDRDQPTRQMLQTFCEYFDGFLVTTTGGKLALQLARPNTADPATLPLIGEYELLDLPNPASTAWRSTTNEFYITYTDRDEYYQSDSESYKDLANLRLLGGEVLMQNLSRPWFTRRYQAQKAAAYAGRINSAPWINSKIVVRKDAGDGIAPGSFIRLTYADFNVTLVMRVLGRKTSADKHQAIELDVRADGYFNDVLPYTPDRPPAPDVPVIDPLVAAASLVIELPWGLVHAGLDRDKPHLAALVARASALDTRYLVYSSDDAGASYDEIGRSHNWAVAGTLAADLPLTNTLDDGASGISLTLAGIDSAADLESTNETGRQKARLLVFVDQEIIAYETATLISGGSKLTGLRRGCYDTYPATHAAGAPVLVIRRRNIKALGDPGFARGSAISIKTPTSTALAVLDLSSAPATALSLVNRTGRPLTPINLRINTLGVTPTYTTGQDLLVEWDATSWRRHPFFDSWDQAYSDTRTEHVVHLADDSTFATLFASRIASGIASLTITNAQLQTACGGSEPAAVRVRVWARRRGIRSLAFLEQRLTKA